LGQSFFDVGAPINPHKRSFPKKSPPIAPNNRGIVILSHWDYDHYALAYRIPALMGLQWFAPLQKVGPNALKFQQQLGQNLHFIKGDDAYGAFQLRRLSGRDRNSSGYVLRIDLDGESVLLTGDAEYNHIPDDLKAELTALMLPHHSGGVSAPPAPATPKN